MTDTRSTPECSEAEALADYLEGWLNRPLYDTIKGGQMTGKKAAALVRSLAMRSESAPIAKGWAIQHADRKRWRTMDTIGMPDWTDDKTKALVCRLKYHIERYAEDDPDDIRIVEVHW